MLGPNAKIFNTTEQVTRWNNFRFSWEWIRRLWHFEL